MITKEYRSVLLQQHETTSWGAEKDFRHMEELRSHMVKTGSQSILDFGSGRKCLQKHSERDNTGWRIFNYDPGTNDNVLPQTVDMVVSADVLEHIEPNFIDETLIRLFTIAQKGLYLVIALREAKAKLVDGRNAHLIVENLEWWQHRLHEAHIRSLRSWEIEGLWHKANREMRIRYVVA